jgi:hypothetical protein
MPYCRRCGAKLAEDALFCYKCGTPVSAPVEQATPTSEAPRTIKSVPLRKNPLFIPVMVIIAITISALVIAAVASAPLNPVNFNQQNQIEQSGVNKLNLDFQADVGQVNVYTNLNGSNAVFMDVSATGATSIFGSNQPVTFTVQNSTVNGSQIVTAKVSSAINFPFTENLHVICNIYVNPKVDLTLNIRSSVGDVILTADSAVKISSLRLETSTGNTELNLNKGVTVNGGLTLQTATGTTRFSMNQINVNGNVTLNLGSSTGNVEMDINQTQKFNGNLQVNAHTGTGNINLNRMLIDGEVAARITSTTGLGNIDLDVQNFNGNKSPIQSNNYPAACNINMNFNSGVGNINIAAVYQTTMTPSLRN